jgi:hypothetical protein
LFGERFVELAPGDEPGSYEQLAEPYPRIVHTSIKVTRPHGTSQNPGEFLSKAKIGHLAKSPGPVSCSKHRAGSARMWVSIPASHTRCEHDVYTKRPEGPDPVTKCGILGRDASVPAMWDSL